MSFYTFAQQKTYVCNERKTEQSLIWALDASSSMDKEEFKTQVNGYIAALKDQAVQNNFFYCQCTEIAVVLWSEKSQIKYNFKQMKDEKSVEDLIGFFSQLAMPNYSLGSMTDLYQALNFSGKEILTRINPNQNPKLAITISGDGYNKHTDPQTLSELRDQKQTLADAGVKINGVPVVIYQYEDFPQARNSGPLKSRELHSGNNNTTGYKDLADFYTKEIITPNGYIEKAETYSDFARAIKNSALRDSCNVMM